MSRIVKIAPALAALTFAFSATADRGCPKVKDKPDVAFHATGTAGLKIDGTGSNLKIDESDGKIVFKVSLKDLKTGIGLRDGHTQKYLETSKWPDASFSIAKDKMKYEGSGTVTGEFRLHGVTVKDKKVKYSVKKNGDHMKVEANFDVNILEHKIEQPCYLGVCMNPDVKVAVNFKAKD
jgi:polyisoprenoid-binding protein YceI